MNGGRLIRPFLHDEEVEQERSLDVFELTASSVPHLPLIFRFLAKVHVLFLRPTHFSTGNHLVEGNRVPGSARCCVCYNHAFFQDWHAELFRLTSLTSLWHYVFSFCVQQLVLSFAKKGLLVNWSSCIPCLFQCAVIHLVFH